LFSVDSWADYCRLYLSPRVAGATEPERCLPNAAGLMTGHAGLPTPRRMPIFPTTPTAKTVSATNQQRSNQIAGDKITSGTNSAQFAERCRSTVGQDNSDSSLNSPVLSPSFSAGIPSLFSKVS